MNKHSKTLWLLSDKEADEFLNFNCISLWCVWGGWDAHATAPKRRL